VSFINLTLNPFKTNQGFFTVKCKILIVDDNEPIRENTAELLGFYQYDVITACNGEEGLAAAIQEAPHLILCDEQMPRINGYELLILIRKISSLNNTRFVFFTASSETIEIEHGMQAGADAYIVKPFTEEELITVIKNALAKEHLPA
jgi:CheY-like chemotaxis protein